MRQTAECNSKRKVTRVKAGENSGMDGMEQILENNCNFGGVAPLNLPLPYPPIRVREKISFMRICLHWIIAALCQS